MTGSEHRNAQATDPSSPVSGTAVDFASHSRFVQRLRRRYADLLGLMPAQIVAQPLAGQDIIALPLEEPGLPLTVGVIVRSGSVVSPAIRQFIAHLHRAAHQLAS